MAARYTREKFAAAFWSRMDRSGSCWLWIGSRIHHGYGRVKRGRRLELAHRVAWELTNGAVPEGMYVLHRCDNPPCSNPAHLFLGDQFANMEDRASKGRSPSSRGGANHNAKLTEHDVAAIRRRYAAGETIAAMAREYGVTWTAIGLAAKRKTWSHV